MCRVQKVNCFHFYQLWYRNYFSHVLPFEHDLDLEKVKVNLTTSSSMCRVQKVNCFHFYQLWYKNYFSHVLPICIVLDAY